MRRLTHRILTQEEEYECIKKKYNKSVEEWMKDKSESNLELLLNRMRYLNEKACEKYGINGVMR